MLRIILFLLVTMCTAAQTAHASECVKPQSVMFLQSEDATRLELARALKTYLREHGRDERLATSIYKASLKTGVDFELMVLKAKMESDLGAQTVAATSTARGVFQYIEPTWMTLMRRYGQQVGYKHYADAIERSHYPNVPQIKDGNKYLKAEILALRHDPDMAAMMKAYQVREETDVIKTMKRGGRVTATDHYIVHMLGLSLAKEFYSMKNRGSVIAVAGLNRPAMREAARMNRVFFYDGKRALTARESYAKFERRVQKEFRAIKAVAHNNKTPACAEAKPELAKFVMQDFTPLCSAHRANLLQPASLHATLYQLSPCGRVRSH